MYIEPTWTELLLKGILIKGLFLTLSIILAYMIYKFITPKLYEKVPIPDFLKEDKQFINIITVIILLALLIIPCSVLSAYTWNKLMEQPSVREDTVTITSIQPLPGAVDITSNGYYITNSNQLMFTTKDGREFANTENLMFGKFETRTIFNQLRPNGTYKIRYYGWRNGYNNEFPNILEVTEVIDESNTTPNEYNKYFGARHGNRGYDVEMYNEYGD